MPFHQFVDMRPLGWDTVVTTFRLSSPVWKNSSNQNTSFFIEHARHHLSATQPSFGASLLTTWTRMDFLFLQLGSMHQIAQYGLMNIPMPSFVWSFEVTLQTRMLCYEVFEQDVFQLSSATRIRFSTQLCNHLWIWTILHFLYLSNPFCGIRKENC